MKLIPVFLIFILFFSHCTKPSSPGGENQNPPVVSAVVADSISAPVAIAPEESEPPKKLVVGFKEVDIFFQDWPEGFTLEYAGLPPEDESTEFFINNRHNRVCRIVAVLWTHLNSLAIGESEYTVGDRPAYRSVLPEGRLSYSFETNGKGYGWIVNVTELDPVYEKWLVSNLTCRINEQTDSLISLVSSAFPLQVPNTVQRIGITFRMEEYRSESFPRTKVWMQLTNFSNLMTNRMMVADITGSVENTTDGKPTFDKGEALVLTNFYAGLNKKFIFSNEGDKLVLYEETEDEPSMEEEGEEGNVTTHVQPKELLTLPVPPQYDFSFVGYYPMSE